MVDDVLSAPDFGVGVVGLGVVGSTSSLGSEVESGASLSYILVRRVGL